MIKLDKRQITYLCITLLYLIETVYPQSFTLAPPSAFEKTRVLIVCAGNTCRSPLASALLRKYLPEAALRQIDITSAGIDATPNASASDGAVGIAREEGIDLTSHRSTCLTTQLINSADIIFVMSREQLEAVRKIAPDKVFLFALDTEVPDPMFGAISYPEAAKVIKDSIPQIKLFLAERFPHLRKDLDPEWEKWQEAITLASNRYSYSDQEKALELLGYNWENPFRQTQAIKLLVGALEWGGRLREIAGAKLIKIGKPAVPHILDAISKGDKKSIFVWELLETLGEIRDPGTIDPLIDLLLQPDSPSTPIKEALYKIGHPYAVERLLDLIVNQNRRERWVLDTLRWIGRLDIKGMFSAWRSARPEVKAILFNIILQLSPDISLGLLIIAIRDNEGETKAELIVIRDSNWFWKDRLNDESRELLEELAYYLYDIDRLHIFPDLVNYLSEANYTGLRSIVGLIKEARTLGSLQPFLLAMARFRFKKNAGFLALLLDRLEYYPPDYITPVLGKETADFLKGIGLTEGLSYQGLVSSQLFWYRYSPRYRHIVIDKLRQTRDILCPELFNRILKERGFQVLANKIILEEVVEVELEPRLTILIHPSAIQFLAESIKDAKIGRRLYFLGSYTRLAQSGLEKDSFKKFLQWNYNARQAMTKPEAIDRLALTEMVDATEKMLYYYKESFTDSEIYRIDERWAGIKAEAYELISMHRSVLPNSPEGRRIIQLSPARIVDSIDAIGTVHDFINFIHQRGLDRRYTLDRERPRDVVPGELVTMLFTSEGEIIDKAKHTFQIQREISGRSILDIPEELRYVIRNLLFFMNGYCHLPGCRIDISGGEVTIFLPIGEHAAQLYINLAQPQQGGMIELHWDEGNLETGNILRQNLMELILGQMRFSVHTNAALIKARFDSESGASTIKDLIDTGARTLRLISGTRDLDYLLTSSAIRYDRYADCIDFIWRMGVPTFRRILEEGSIEPYLEALNRWEFIMRDVLNRYLRNLGLEELPSDIPFGPNMVNTYFNKQIDRAIGRQELSYDSTGQLIRNSNYNEPSQVRTFAELLQDPAKRSDLIIMANLLHEVINLVPARVVIIGNINGYLVRRIQLEFPGKVISLWGLYHPTGQILASYGALGERLNRLTDPNTGEVSDNVITSPKEIVDILKRQGLYLSRHLLEISSDDLRIRNLRLDRSLARPQFIPLVNLGAAVRFAGVKVSGGLATGRAIFNTPVKSPDDFVDAVLVAPYTTPRDEPKMEQAEAIVTTGGGPLTHTGIIARELRKPSLIISGEWARQEGEDVIKVEYEIFTRVQEQMGGYTIIRRININPKETVIVEGDILTIDGTSGTLYNWGQAEGILEAWELCKLIQTEKDWKAWHRLREIARNTRDRQVARFLIHKIFAGRLSTILELDEKLEFVSSLCLNEILGEEGREFLHRLSASWKDELGILIREYTARIKKSTYPREILQLMKEIEERQMSLVLLYKVLELDEPGSLKEDIQALKGLVQTQYQRLGIRVLSELEPHLRGLPKNPKRIRHLRNLWREAEFLSTLTSLDLRRFKPIYERLQRWEKGQQERVGQLKDKDTLPLDQIDVNTLPLVGAKAATLGEIARVLHRRSIPNGFSITDNAFQRFMEHNNFWRRIEEIMASQNTPEKKYELVQEAFDHSQWPEDMEKEVLEQYHRLEKSLTLEEKGEYINEIVDKVISDEEMRNMVKGVFARDKEQKENQWRRMTIGEIINQIELIPPGTREKLLRYNEEQSGPMVAVRSSAVGSEDSPQASFAGEMETFLYQRGREAVLFHVKRCMASLWTPRVISYRDWHGFPQTGLHHSIFIQLMVDSEVSAVGFTIDPASGDWNQIVLNAGWGIGEGIMGGRVNTDFYSIDKYAPLGEGVVREIRSKPTMFTFDREGGRGTRHVDVPSGRVGAATLDTKNIEVIRDILIKLERYWGMPRDIELAIDKDGNIKIVQDRPVTALNGHGKIHREAATREVLEFGDAIKRFDKIRRNTEFTKPELQLIALVLLRKLKPSRIEEDRLLDEKALEAIDLLIKLRSKPDILEGLITEAVNIVMGDIEDPKLLELKSLVPNLISRLFLYSNREGLIGFSVENLRKYLLQLLNDPYLKGYINLIPQLNTESAVDNNQYKIYLGLDLLYKKEDGVEVPFNIGLAEALQRLRAIKNAKGQRLIEVEFISSHPPDETLEIMHAILGNQAEDFRVNYYPEIPVQKQNVVYILSQGDLIPEGLKDSGLVLILPKPGEGQFISGRGLLITALAWLECGGDARQMPDNLKDLFYSILASLPEYKGRRIGEEELQEFLTSGPRPIPLTKEYEGILTEEAAMNRSV